MSKKKLRIVSILVFCNLLLILGGCSKNHIPKEVPDILTMIYKNMSNLSSYSYESTLSMDMEMSKKSSDIEIVTKVSFAKEPLDLTIVNRSEVENATPTETYIYCTKEKDEYYSYSYEKGNWSKSKPDDVTLENIKKQYASPIEFDLYFINIDSFQISEQTKEETILVGTVSKENVIKILKDTGVLKQLSLTSFPEDDLDEISPITVRVSIDNDSVCVTKFEVDMTQTYQFITSKLFGNESLVNPVINRCVMTIDQIKTNNAETLELPKEASEALDALKEAKE